MPAERYCFLAGFVLLGGIAAIQIIFHTIPAQHENDAYIPTQATNIDNKVKIEECYYDDSPPPSSSVGDAVQAVQPQSKNQSVTPNSAEAQRMDPCQMRYLTWQWTAKPSINVGGQMDNTIKEATYTAVSKESTFNMANEEFANLVPPQRGFYHPSDPYVIHWELYTGNQIGSGFLSFLLVALTLSCCAGLGDATQRSIVKPQATTPRAVTSV
ncbi:Hypothetical protein POVN_LOCUS324 [uncultured virus]|nr:Hypothetical protein POVN_LOCUS324 [uncultured virus]